MWQPGMAQPLTSVVRCRRSPGFVAVALMVRHAGVDPAVLPSMSSAMSSAVSSANDATRALLATDAAASDAPSQQILVAMTACNQWHLSSAAVDNLASLTDDIHVIVFDDHSEDGTAELARLRGVEVVAMDAPMGVTHAWNLAYQHFKSRPQYSALFIVNNDITFPNNSFTRMAQVCWRRGKVGACLFLYVQAVTLVGCSAVVQVLQQVSGPAVVGPVTTRKGLGRSSKRARRQCLEHVFPEVGCVSRCCLDPKTFA